VFETRQRPSRVPNLFYRRRRERDQRSMEDAVEAIITRAG
jgi:hypothetical protein